jgi:hypothetical protein
MVQRLRPVSRWRVLATALAFGVAIAGIVGLAEALRHPPGEARAIPELDEPSGDPRDPIVCPEPLPREGQPRTGEDGRDRVPVRAAGAQEERPLSTGTAPEVTSGQLHDCPQVYDGVHVRMRGEVVGGLLRRRGGAWVQLNDDLYGGPLGPLPGHRDYRGANSGVGVWLPNELVGHVTAVGGPGTRGDVLEVVGRFHRVDPVSAEVAIVRASSARLIEPGRPITDPVLPRRRLAAILLGLLAVAAVIVQRVQQART